MKGNKLKNLLKQVKTKRSSKPKKGKVQSTDDLPAKSIAELLKMAQEKGIESYIDSEGIERSIEYANKDDLIRAILDFVPSEMSDQDARLRDFLGSFKKIDESQFLPSLRDFAADPETDDEIKDLLNKIISEFDIKVIKGLINLYLKGLVEGVYQKRMDKEVLVDYKKVKISIEEAYELTKQLQNMEPVSEGDIRKVLKYIDLDDEEDIDTSLIKTGEDELKEISKLPLELKKRFIKNFLRAKSLTLFEFYQEFMNDPYVVGKIKFYLKGEKPEPVKPPRVGKGRINPEYVKILNEPVNANLSKYAGAQGVYASNIGKKILKDYLKMENADQVASEIVKAIVEQSKTIGDFATQLGKLVIFLDSRFNSDFINKLNKGYYNPRALVNLSQEEKLPEIFLSTNEQNFANELSINLDVFVIYFAEKVYINRDPFARITNMADFIVGFKGRYKVDDEFKKKCFNFDDIKNVPTEKLYSYYDPNQKKYCLVIDEILSQNNVVGGVRVYKNPYTGSEISSFEINKMKTEDVVIDYKMDPLSYSCSNYNDIKDLPRENLIYYKEGDKMYCFDVDDVLKNNNFVNTYTNNAFSEDFINYINSHYQLPKEEVAEVVQEEEKVVVDDFNAPDLLDTLFESVNNILSSNNMPLLKAFTMRSKISPGIDSGEDDDDEDEDDDDHDDDDYDYGVDSSKNEEHKKCEKCGDVINSDDHKSIKIKDNNIYLIYFCSNECFTEDKKWPKLKKDTELINLI